MTQRQSPVNNALIRGVGLEPIVSNEVILLAPLSEFWHNFENSLEYQDNQPDPMDRYSKRIINLLADTLDTKASFPSDGPPFPPFITWALEAEGIYSSPLGLLVHDRFGLSLSFRGALHIKNQVKRVNQNPCTSCAKPCLTACPVNAFETGTYDVQGCQTHLRSGDVDCWQGCLARRICPANKIPHATAHYQFSMRAFCATKAF